MYDLIKLLIKKINLSHLDIKNIKMLLINPQMHYLWTIHKYDPLKYREIARKYFIIILNNNIGLTQNKKGSKCSPSPSIP